MNQGLELVNHLPVFAAGSPALTTFFVYTLVVFGLAALSSRLLKDRNFLSEYFLGSRSLGVWALALTFAATMASGGSFTGFPSLIYTHGWVLALWIGSYMVFPICTMALLGKRLNQVARKSGAITVPDILRDRFQSRSFAVLATLLIVFFMCVNLVAQFKAGSVILMTLLNGVDAYEAAAVSFASVTDTIPLLAGIDPGYVLCLLVFGVAVIVYTTWGGFHAVVWTDVMQGIVMVVGVMVMLPLALSQVGGLKSATTELARMVPPHPAKLLLASDSRVTSAAKGTWLKHGDDGDNPARVFRVGDPSKDDQGQVIPNQFDAIEIVYAGDLQRIDSGETVVEFDENISIAQIISSDAVSFPGTDRPGSFVTAPGPHATKMDGFLPLSLAFSFFFMWAISGTGQPGGMVRLMAFKDTKTLRVSIVTVAVYYSFIYVPLIVVFCCARILLPGMEVESDRIMPQMAVTLTSNAGVGWMAGLLVAAPFAAVMSTVDSFLLMISSSVVRDIYQRNINPKASEETMKKMSYLCTVLVGAAVVVVAMNPPEFLQYIIIYVGSGLAACFLAPVALALYWPRMTATGAICSMLAGFLSHLSLYVLGAIYGGGFDKPVRPFSIDPVVVGLFMSFTAGCVATMLSSPPPEALVRKYFYCRKKSE